VDGFHRIQNHLAQHSLSLRESELRLRGQWFELNERGAHCQPTSLFLLQFKKCHKLWHFSLDADAGFFSVVKALCLFFIRTLLTQ
jgi:hypothetical protein